MPSINEILGGTMTEQERIKALKRKTVSVPTWGGVNGLESEYDATMHPVMDKRIYPDVRREDSIERVTRITLSFQKLAATRMSELCTGVPVKRVYKPDNDKQKKVAEALEKIYDRNRINSVNTKRCKQFFAGCEIFTLWYAIEQRNSLYGFSSPLKLRCRTFSPMLGDELYPFFDEYGDMTAMSIAYTRKVGEKDVQFFDTYTDGENSRHIKWSNESGDWAVVEDETTTLLKIPGVYQWRPKPIWEDTSRNIYEMEWSLSRNGNYLRENSKPKFVVCANEVIQYGDEKSPDKEFKAVAQFPTGAKAEYVTWQQATESLKFHIETLRSLYFTQLQLPDWSYEKMSQQALSGESRKQMFIDAELKVQDESGDLLEFFDREVNVVKAFLKLMMGSAYYADIDALVVENIITPYRITDAKETVELLLTANGNKPIMSQREAIEQYGHSDDIDQTLKEIAEQEMQDTFELTQ